MLALLIYALIGLFAGIIAKNYMPGKVADGTLLLALTGITGAVALGLATVLLFSYGRAYDYWYGYSYVAGTDDHHGSGLPAYWMSFIAAMVGALGSLAVYKLVRGRWMNV